VLQITEQCGPKYIASDTVDRCHQSILLCSEGFNKSSIVVSALSNLIQTSDNMWHTSLPSPSLSHSAKVAVGTRFGTCALVRAL
jgi:hypothetical protein